MAVSLSAAGVRQLHGSSGLAPRDWRPVNCDLMGKKLILLKFIRRKTMLNQVYAWPSPPLPQMRQRWVSSSSKNWPVKRQRWVNVAFAMSWLDECICVVKGPWDGGKGPKDCCGYWEVELVLVFSLSQSVVQNPRYDFFLQILLKLSDLWEM